MKLTKKKIKTLMKQKNQTKKNLRQSRSKKTRQKIKKRRTSAKRNKHINLRKNTVKKQRKRRYKKKRGGQGEEEGSTLPAHTETLTTTTFPSSGEPTTVEGNPVARLGTGVEPENDPTQPIQSVSDIKTKITQKKLTKAQKEAAEDFVEEAHSNPLTMSETDYKKPQPEGSDVEQSQQQTETRSLSPTELKEFDPLSEAGEQQDSDKPVEEQVEGQVDAPAEGQVDAPAEGQVDAPAEGEDVATVEGQDVATVEGEVDASAEGEVDAPAEGQVDAPVDAPEQTQEQVDTPAEGEVDASAEGEESEEEKQRRLEQQREQNQSEEEQRRLQQEKERKQIIQPDVTKLPSNVESDKAETTQTKAKTKSPIASMFSRPTKEGNKEVVITIKMEIPREANVVTQSQVGETVEEALEGVQKEISS